MSKRILSEIWIYPVKSLGGIRLHSSRVLEKGLLHDRRWMLVDADNVFMTQRIFPKMALFKLSMGENAFTIRFGNDRIEVPMIQRETSEELHSIIWEDAVTTQEVSAEYSRWFSDRLEMTCRLVSFPEENLRPIDPLFRIKDENVSLADAYPLLIIGQSSLDNLNGKMDPPVPMNRFRPNLVFTGGEAHEEDGWKDFKIGRNRFAGVKPCARCVLITINQDTAEKGIEPLATLARYRKEGAKVLFGQNLIPIDHDEITEGDEIIF